MTTWRDLLSPDYMLAFLDSFLVGALPVLGLGSFANGGLEVTGAHVAAWPSGPMIAGGLAAGLLTGLRAIRNLRTPPPAPR